MAVEVLLVVAVVSVPVEVPLVAVADLALPVVVVVSVAVVVLLGAVAVLVLPAVLPVVVVASVDADIRSVDPVYCLLTAFGGYGSFVQEYLFRLVVHPAQLQLNWLHAVEYHQSQNFCLVVQ